MSTGFTKCSHFGKWSLEKREESCLPKRHRGRHQGFYPLVNHPFPKHSTAKNRRAATAAKRRTAVGLSLCRGAHCASITLPLRNARYLSTTHTGYSTQARHDSAAQLGYTLLRPTSTNSHSFVLFTYHIRRAGCPHPLFFSLICTNKMKKTENEKPSGSFSIFHYFA